MVSCWSSKRKLERPHRLASATGGLSADAKFGRSPSVADILLVPGIEVNEGSVPVGLHQRLAKRSSQRGWLGDLFCGSCETRTGLHRSCLPRAYGRPHAPPNSGDD